MIGQVQHYISGVIVSALHLEDARDAQGIMLKMYHTSGHYWLHLTLADPVRTRNTYDADIKMTAVLKRDDLKVGASRGNVPTVGTVQGFKLRRSPFQLAATLSSLTVAARALVYPIPGIRLSRI